MARPARLAALALLTVFIIAPGLIPVQLSYVTSGSMEPTLSTGDGYLVTSLGDVDRGDIITFYSTEKAEYVTHRVAEIRPEGYVTKGDANPSTDQAGGDPLVTDDAVLGKVVTVAGNPLVLPNVGGAIEWVQANGHLLLAGLVLVVVFRIMTAGSHLPKRELTLVREVIPPLVGTLVLLSFIVLSLATSTHHLAYVVAEDVGANSDAIAVGEESTEVLSLSVLQSPLTTTVLAAEGMTIEERTLDDGTLELLATIHPQEEAGLYMATVRVYAYPPVLPRATLTWLTAVSPLLARLVSVGIVAAPFAAIYWLFFDGGTPLRWTRRQLTHGGDR